MAATSVLDNWDGVVEGTPIPELMKIPSPMQLFMFSAVTWNRHLIHYSSEFAIRDGLKNVAVHRALLGGFLAQMLTNWLGAAGEVAKIEWNVRGSAAIDKPLTCRGTITGKRVDGGRRFIDLDVWVENHEGELIVPGKAVVRLHADW